MRGSVVKKNDRWYVVIEDRDPATGARKRRWHSGFRTNARRKVRATSWLRRCNAVTTYKPTGRR